MSVLDLSKMDAYSTAWENMAAELDDVITSTTTWNKFVTLLNKCQRFGATDNNGTTVYYYEIFDVQDWCDYMQADTTFANVDTVDAVEEALNDLVYYDIYGKDNSDACGLNLFCPANGYAYSYSYTSTETNYSTWRALVNTYGSYYSGK